MDYALSSGPAIAIPSGMDRHQIRSFILDKNDKNDLIDAHNSIDRVWICIEILEGIRYGLDEDFGDLIYKAIDELKLIASNRLNLIDKINGPHK